MERRQRQPGDDRTYITLFVDCPSDHVPEEVLARWGTDHLGYYGLVMSITTPDSADHAQWTNQIKRAATQLVGEMEFGLRDVLAKDAS